ncbi:MAG TPA: D-alanine--D-alanine ligase [Thermodesulfobacteriaceae bacterium]|nr:D-alanine--D-alanine ligase [Thermodesulfobacteriaceae bacterium]
MPEKKIRLALLCGGVSAEREVSLLGASEVRKAMDPRRYVVKHYDPASDLEKLVREAPELDAAFILLHGPYGEDGTVQGLLDLLGIPYQGSGVLGSALAMDKHLSKVAYRAAGIPTPKWIHIRSTDSYDASHVVHKLGLPLMVKPCSQGSSIGMSKVEDGHELEDAVREAFRWDQRVIVESFVSGREITGGVLGLNDLQPLPIVEIITDTDHAFFDYDAKYRANTKEICPAAIPGEITRQAWSMAEKAHRSLELRGYSRTDMILTGSGKLSVLETNTIPGMTPTSLFPQAAKAAGISFDNLIDRLVDMAISARHKMKFRPAQ